MAYSLIAHTHFKGAANGGTTPAINTTGADLIVLGIVANNNTSTNPTDSNSNTWTGLTQQNSGAEKAKLYYCHNPTVGAGHTFSIGGASEFAGIYVEAFSGSASSPFDVQNGSTVIGASTLQPGSITPSQNNELIIAFESDNYNGGSGGTQSIDSSFTITDQDNAVGGVCLGASMSYLFQGTAAAINPTWTVTGGNRNFAGVIASFKALGDANVGLPATSATGSAQAVSVEADKNVSLGAVSSSGAIQSLSLVVNSNISLANVSVAGLAATISAIPGITLGSVSASGVAASFSQNKSLTLAAASASTAVASFFASSIMVSESTIGAMSDKLAIDAIATDRPVASNGTMSTEPVAAIGSLLAA